VQKKLGNADGIIFNTLYYSNTITENFSIMI